MSAVVEQIPQPQLPKVTAADPMMMLQIAVSQGADIDKLKQLMDLQERWEKNQARKAFTSAMAAFKASPPTIVKDKHVKFGNTEYDHATLGSLCAQVVKGLAEHGVSHRWDVAQHEGRIKVTCVLTHEMGHSESVSLNSEADDSGSKNAIQAIGSAVTYLQRYTLLSATGLAAVDQDDDGKAAARDKGDLNPRGDLGKNQDQSKVGVYVKRFLEAMQADKEEIDIAADVYKIHLEICSDADFYIAVGNNIGSKYKGALRKYVELHRKNGGK